MELLIAFINVSIGIFFLIFYRQNFIYFYIIFNILNDVVLGFVSIDSNLIALSRAFVSLSYIFYIFFKTNAKLFNANHLMLVFFIYIVSLIPFSSNFNTSISSSLKVFITMSMFPIGMVFFDSITKLKKLNVTVIWVMIIFCLNFLIANIFQIGLSPYSNSGEYYVGNLKLSSLNTSVYCLLIIPSIFYFNSKFYKKITILISIPTFLFFILSMKRISIMALFLGLVIMIFFSKKKLYYFKWVTIFAFLIFSFQSFYSDTLFNQINLRQDQLNVGILKSEARYHETFNVLDRTLFSENITNALFGVEVFNSVGNYGFFDQKRPIHVDYNLLIFSLGFIGLLMYLMIHLKIFTNFLRIKSGSDNEYFSLVLRPLFFAIFFNTLLISFSGGILGITHRTLAFLYMGAIVGVIKNYKNKTIR